MQIAPEPAADRPLASVIDSLPLGILLTTPDHRIAAANAAHCRMLASPSTPEDLIGSDVRAELDRMAGLAVDPRAFRDRLDRIVATSDTIVAERIELRDGRILERDHLVVPDDGEGWQSLWVHRDVTAAERDLQRARSRASARDALLATISHDVRTPVAGIVGLVDLLLQQPLEPRTRELVDALGSSASALTTMLDDLLDLARVDAGQLELDVQPTPICDLVEHVVAMVGPSAQAKSLPLIGAATADVPEIVRTDAGRLTQVLLNLVANAVKFTAEGAVALLADRDGTDLVLTVTDSGPGMPASVRATVFEEFVQGSGAVHRQHRGAGLGLAIARRLTEALGGTIEVTSQVGVGSTFVVRLPGIAEGPEERVPPTGQHARVVGPPAAVPPVARALERMGIVVLTEDDAGPRAGTGPAARAVATPATILHVVVAAGVDAAQAVPPPPPGDRLVVLVPAALATCPPLAGTPVALPWTRQRLAAALRDDGWGQTGAGPLSHAGRAQVGTGRRVLLAEDEPSNRRIIAEMLTRLGAEVTAVADGLEAVGAMAADRFDLVLMDLGMPVLDGLSAVEVIASRMPADALPPILALTAEVGADPALLARAGFAGVVAKPVTTDGLARVLRDTAQEIAPERAPVSAAALVDLARDIGDESVVHETVAIYLDELPTRLGQMDAATAAADMEGVRQAAHALKSSSAMLGADDLAGLCRDLEAATAAAARTGATEGGDVSPLVHVLTDEALRVAQWLAEFRDAGYPGLGAEPASSGT